MGRSPTRSNLRCLVALQLEQNANIAATDTTYVWITYFRSMCCGLFSPSVLDCGEFYYVRKCWRIRSSILILWKIVTLRQALLPVLWFFAVGTIPPLLHSHSSIYHPRCIMFFSQHFSFPLSVSFHHCSIHIHPSTTHTV